MKALVIYDSMYGNTEQIAKAIAGAIAGEVKLLRVGEVKFSELESTSLLIIGSPTQVGSPTKVTQEFLNRLPSIKGIGVAAFDTRLATKLVGIFGYAAGKIAGKLKENGGNLISPPEAFFVKGRTGPLKDGELERAATWAKTLLTK